MNVEKEQSITLFHFKRQKDQSIHKGKSKVAQNEKQNKNCMSFLTHNI